MQFTQTISGLPTPYEKETITVSTTPIGLTLEKYLQRGAEATRDMGNARYAMISVEDATVRWWPHTDPASGQGHELPAGSFLTLGSFSQLKGVRFIRHEDATNDAVIQVSYYR